MLTLKHFFDRPTWAAAAGYDFNFIDCMSEAINRLAITKGVVSLIKEIPDIELRSAAWALPLSLACILIAMLWPFLYPILAIHTYVKCKFYAKKYRTQKPERVATNIAVWLRDFEDK